MPNLFQCFGLIIIFSEIICGLSPDRLRYYVQHEKTRIIMPQSIQKKAEILYASYIMGLCLDVRRHANRVLISQESFKKFGLIFRNWLWFVLDLPIRLIKITLTMSGLNFYFEEGRNRWVLFVSSLLLSLLLCLGLWFSPVGAQAQNGFTQPASGDVLSGIVIVQGTATDNAFLRYELAFLNETGPSSDWIVFAQGDQPVVNGTLAVWDTTIGRGSSRVFPDGRYQLRLRVVRTDFNYDEYFVTNLTIANESVTPSPTPTLTTTAPAETVTPEVGETALPVLTQPAPDVLPSLTPFPTPSPQATPVNEPLGPGSDGSDGETEERQGVFEQISGIDVGQFEAAFWQGVRFVAIAFGLLAAYVMLRGVFRRLWRLLSNKYLR